MNLKFLVGDKVGHFQQNPEQIYILHKSPFVRRFSLVAVEELVATHGGGIIVERICTFFCKVPK